MRGLPQIGSNRSSGSYGSHHRFTTLPSVEPREYGSKEGMPSSMPRDYGNYRHQNH